ncbi:hypothetical protein [Acidovorax sp. CCYZU-2555]|uniref:hypothetical protein n=1 Tax=Acidovorax sp. CCYZU-2555 TaxID=2835042 RepID=UPI001BCBBD99|nr:hypothetical protein [Acidovorax sp. CCYZU-2555]MBS7778902.1 hypothetical protein [Acidovorax sp. CCYZU-2555]
MPTTAEIEQDLSAVQTLIPKLEHGVQYMAFLRKQPDLMYTLNHLREYFPYLLQLMRQAQQEHGLSALSALDYVQHTWLPYQLDHLSKRQQELESQLRQVATEQEQQLSDQAQQPEAGTENPPTAKSGPLETTSSEQVNPAECRPSDGDGDAREQQDNAQHPTESAKAAIGADLDQPAEVVLNTLTTPDEYRPEEEQENEDLNAVSQGDDNRNDDSNAEDSNGAETQEFIPAIVGAHSPSPDHLS